jgi:hypothetical protein
VKAALVLLLAAALALAACGGEETVTVTEEAPAPAEGVPAPAEGAAPEADAGGDRARVPNVVGENHQYAQDTMQAAGFYVLDERDCSGQDRLLLWDRNWVVQEQTPSAGTMASVDATVTLCSVKEGE